MDSKYEVGQLSPPSTDMRSYLDLTYTYTRAVNGLLSSASRASVPGKRPNDESQEVHKVLSLGGRQKFNHFGINSWGRLK